LGADRLIALGVFGAPQGVRGEIRIKSYTAEPAAVGGYGPLTDAAGTRSFAVKIVRPWGAPQRVPRGVGGGTRAAAAALTGVELFARRSQLPPPEAEEFYHDDLIGLAAMTPDGAAFGRVLAVVNHGAGDLLEIARPEGPTALLAFTRAVVPEIDFSGGRIVVIPPVEVDGEPAS
jgi:16S rRNA processing protein RimM